MLEYEFLKIVNDYVKIYREFPLPAVITNLNFEVYWSNSLTKTHCVQATDTGGLRRLLSEFRMEEIVRQVMERGNYTIGEVSPFSDLQMSFSPVLANSQTKGIIILLMGKAGRPEAGALQKSSRAANALTNNIRESMGAIFSAMDVAAAKADFMDADWIKASFNHIGVQNYRILRIAANISEYTNYQNGSMLLHFQAADLYSLLQGMEEVVRELARSMGIPVQFQIPQGHMAIRLDVDKFETALFNILHNSLYFTRPNNRVVVRVHDEGDSVFVAVEDRGLGIPAQLLGDVVRPYETYPHEGRGPGVGLGLALASAIAQSHGGNLKIASREGEGTTVTLQIPKGTFSQEMPLRQSDVDHQLQNDRFSSVYTGLSDAVLSPYSGR